MSGREINEVMSMMKSINSEPHTSLKGEILYGKEAISTIAKDWDELFERATAAPPYLSYAWVNTFVETGRLTGKPQIIVVRSGRKLVALLTLAVRRFLGVTIAEPIGIGEPSYLGILLDPQWPNALYYIANLFVTEGVADVFRNSDLYSEDISTNRFIDILVRKGFFCKRVYRDPCRCINLGCSYEEYLMKSKSSKTRKKLRKEKRRLFNYGDVEILKYEGKKLSKEVFCRIAKVQQKSRLKKKGAAVLGLPFYQKLLLNMARAGFAKVWLMTIDGEDAAFKYTFVAHERLYLHWTAFDLRYKSSSVSVGKVLTMIVIKDACDDNIAVVDFLHGDGYHKRFWGNECHSVYRVVAGRGLTGRLLAVCYFVVWKLAEIEWLRSKYRSVRKRFRVLFTREG